MSQFFNTIKKTLGISKDKNNDVQQSPHLLFALTFYKPKLGMGINCYKGVLPTDSIDGIRVPGAGDNERTWPVTTTIAPASEAFEYGIFTLLSS